MILSSLNASATTTYNFIIQETPGQSMTYTSIDTSITDEGAVAYPTEFLNSIESGSLPPHKLQLKIDTPIIILRNIKPPTMLNGTRAIVTILHNNVIEATKTDGTTILIPRISLTPSDTSTPIKFRRKQFPIKPCYAMTIDRSQGQTLDVVGVDLRNPCFNSGQLCVALSRTRSPSNIAVLLPEGTKTRNPVYTECLQD